MLQPILLQPLAQNQLLLQLQGGPLQSLLIAHRERRQSVRIATARNGRYAWEQKKPSSTKIYAKSN